MENLTICERCKGNACLVEKVKEDISEKIITTYFCFGCGFATTDKHLVDSTVVESLTKSSPELYKDLLYNDSNGLVWFPVTITLPKVGMVFLDGVSKTEWGWSAVKAVEIPQEEKDRYPENETHKIDITTKKYFEKNQFMDALEEIEFFKI